jgi:hypothetical protein
MRTPAARVSLTIYARSVCLRNEWLPNIIHIPVECKHKSARAHLHVMLMSNLRCTHCAGSFTHSPDHWSNNALYPLLDVHNFYCCRAAKRGAQFVQIPLRLYASMLKPVALHLRGQTPGLQSALFVLSPRSPLVTHPARRRQVFN